VQSDVAPSPATTASGTIDSYTRTAAGEPDGFMLASGQRVRIPVALGAQVTDKFPTNTKVLVTGHLRTEPDGRQVIEADRLTNPDSNATLTSPAARFAQRAPERRRRSGPVDPQRPMSTPVPPTDTTKLGTRNCCRSPRGAPRRHRGAFRFSGGTPCRPSSRS
jgi:hypothetical protein